ncbi:MAG TPA: hypothetical protein P5246_05170 [Candidatus Omnitrophota bacterium]|jgi:putative transposase|nr:hypothetical protein [Candidatus Omnitrophota bacterium]HSA31872.1 hypothetical protein [Candidatus Omnitrophota bacterium]
MEHLQGGISYLVVLRRIGARPIFRSRLDFKLYLKILKGLKDKYQVRVFGFCLLEKMISLVVFSKGIEPATKFLNDVNARFEEFVRSTSREEPSIKIGRSRFIAIEYAEDLEACLNYIEQLPLREDGQRHHPDTYEWSSRVFRKMGFYNGLLDAIYEQKTL